MTPKAITEIMEMIVMYYPEMTARIKSPKQMATAWGYALSGIPDDVGKTALLDYVQTEKFPPHVSDIITRARQIEGEGNGDNVESYVEESMRAIRGDLKFEELSDVCKGYWKSQAAIDEVGFSGNFVADVVRGQLHRRLPEIIAKKHMIENAPENLKARIELGKANGLADRQKRLLELQRDIVKDAAQLPEQTEKERSEREERYKAVIG